MAQDKKLREMNRRLLEQLKQTQNEISKQIVTVRHSDDKILTSMPLTSTLATKSIKNNKPHHQTPTAVHKPSGIKKKSHTLGNYQEIKNSPSTKYPIISEFLQSQTKKGKVVSFVDPSFPPNETLLTDPGNDRHSCSRKSMKNTKILRDTAGNQSKFVITPKKYQQKESPPLLGYDFVAGLVENQDPTNALSDSYLNEVKEFRDVNHSECHSKMQWNEMLKTVKSPHIEATPRTKPYRSALKTPDPSDTRSSSVVNFTVNKRLFMLPMDPEENIKSPSARSPRFVRVSIPKASLISPYDYSRRYKQNNALGGEDTLALPDHCARGWQNTVARSSEQKTGQHANIDLWSSVHVKENLTSLQIKSGQRNALAFAL
ncbi:unnamed protein product [Clavelina lepadiformis]|uniref:Uncharacterized protein n=1 Tax=Clavelina lepadiformis TaxID=159417 RepID=A0ABP0FW46_CLALP